MCKYVYVCVCIYMYVYVCVCMRMYVYVCSCTVVKTPYIGIPHKIMYSGKMGKTKVTFQSVCSHVSSQSVDSIPNLYENSGKYIEV